MEGPKAFNFSPYNCKSFLGLHHCIFMQISYSYASLPQEKVWAKNSKICKESYNPIYEPTEDQQATALYESADNTYEQVDEDKAAETENPLYDVGEVTSTLVIREATAPS